MAEAPLPLITYTTDPSDVVGRILDGRYLIESILGKGAMGLVLGARHTYLDKLVAIKVLHPTLTGMDAMRERFLREAKASSALTHEGVVAVNDFGVTAEGLHYLVMEYLEGMDLYEWSAKVGALPAQKVAAIGAQICAALGAIHAAGYVHRDLKPENIWVMSVADAQGVPLIKVLDLGIAGLIDKEGSRLTKTGHTLGTVHYMSPEQALADGVDGRSDLYALGCLLWELSTGQCTFDGTSQMAIMMKHMSEEPVPPSEHSPNLPEWFDAVVMRLLEKKREDRYQNAEAVRQALMAHLSPAEQRGADTLTGAAGAAAAGAAGAAGAYRPVLDVPSATTVTPGFAKGDQTSTVPPRAAMTGVTKTTTHGQLKPPPRHLWKFALAVLLLAGVGVLVAAPWRAEPSPADGLSEVTPAVAEMEPATEAGATTAAKPMVGVVPSVVPVPTSADKAGVDAVDAIALTFDVTPKGTEVYRDDRRLGSTPLVLDVAPDGAQHRYEFRLEGHKTQQKTITHATSQAVVFALAPEPAATKAVPPGKTEGPRNTKPTRPSPVTPKKTNTAPTPGDPNELMRPARPGDP